MELNNKEYASYELSKLMNEHNLFIISEYDNHIYYRDDKDNLVSGFYKEDVEEYLNKNECYVANDIYFIQKIFRNVFDIHIEVYFKNNTFRSKVVDMYGIYDKSEDDLLVEEVFDKYEEALNQGLITAFKLIDKNKK